MDGPLEDLLGPACAVGQGYQPGDTGGMRGGPTEGVAQLMAPLVGHDSPSQRRQQEGYQRDAHHADGGVVHRERPPTLAWLTVSMDRAADERVADGYFIQVR